MYSKIKKRFDELGSVPSLIIKHGLQLSCVLLSAGFIVRLINNCSGSFSFYLRALSQYIAEAGVTISAIIIIGGLMLDYYSKKSNADG